MFHTSDHMHYVLADRGGRSMKSKPAISSTPEALSVKRTFARLHLKNIVVTNYNKS
jgi:hypothetical protein